MGVIKEVVGMERQFQSHGLGSTEIYGHGQAVVCKLYVEKDTWLVDTFLIC